MHSSIVFLSLEFILYVSAKNFNFDILKQLGLEQGGLSDGPDEETFLTPSIRDNKVPCGPVPFPELSCEDRVIVTTKTNAYDMFKLRGVLSTKATINYDVIYSLAPINRQTPNNRLKPSNRQRPNIRQKPNNRQEPKNIQKPNNRQTLQSTLRKRRMTKATTRPSPRSLTTTTKMKPYMMDLNEKYRMLKQGSGTAAAEPTSSTMAYGFQTTAPQAEDNNVCVDHAKCSAHVW